MPATPVISPTQPEPQDVEVLLAGAYVPPDRMGATWRLLETLVQGIAWGSTRMSLTEQSLADLDFALARGGVSAAVGIRHLLNTKASLNLIPVQGLTVGWHRHEKALAMAGAYRSAMPQIKTEEQREMISGLAIWLDGFVPWAQVAASLRPAGPRPDRLLGALTRTAPADVRVATGHSQADVTRPAGVDHQHEVAAFDLLDGAEGEPLDRAGDRGGDRGLHLHRLDGGHGGSGLDLVALGHGDRDHPGEGGGHVTRAWSGRPARRP